ncbi:MAG: NAD-dependent epimerase/dehydratase family protein [Candidatus Fermentibacteria bacterium]
MKVLITGGAGFIGSHLGDLMIEKGYQVRALDNLDPQVHGENARRPDYLHPEIELIVGDVRNHSVVRKALDGCGMLVHFAAAVGVGQSMYRMEHYTSVNSLGTAVVLEEAVRKRSSLTKMLVASSMSIYGEGLYKCPDCGSFAPELRSSEPLLNHKWEVYCPVCGEVAVPLAVPETKPLYPTSIYATNKRSQEEMFLTTGLAYDIPTVAMRFFNVYGTRQALSNPYTGVGAIFASRLLNGNPPVIFEDGLQSRDFIHVKDIARACLMALENPDSANMVLNAGTGKPTSILEIGTAIARELGRPSDDFIVRNQFRAGDIRHCFADISRTKDLLGFTAEIDFARGVSDLCAWVKTCTSTDLVDSATEELQEHGLTK